MDTKKELLYETIVEELKTGILNRTYKPGDRLPTEMELAERYNVSRITSKRALEELKSGGYIYRIRGSGSFVSADLKEPAPVAADNGVLPAGEKEIVSFILPFDVSNGSFARSLSGASEVLDRNGFYISVYNGVKDIKAVERLILKLYKDKIKGIIYYPLSDRDNFEILNMLYLENYPVVTIDKYFESLPISYVVSDNEAGAALATQYLVDYGHERIAFVSDLSIESISSIRNRYFGYSKTLKLNRIPFDPDLVRVSVTGIEFSRSYQKDVYQSLMKSLVSVRASAIFAVNDLIASYLMRAAFELGINIPQDISIIGFDDMEIAKHLQIPLTTVSQDFYAMGKNAGELICSAIRGGAIEYAQLKLPVDLVVRESCRRI